VRTEKHIKHVCLQFIMTKVKWTIELRVPNRIQQQVQ